VVRGGRLAHLTRTAHGGLAHLARAARGGLAHLARHAGLVVVRASRGRRRARRARVAVVHQLAAKVLDPAWQQATSKSQPSL